MNNEASNPCNFVGYIYKFSCTLFCKRSRSERNDRRDRDRERREERNERDRRDVDRRVEERSSTTSSKNNSNPSNNPNNNEVLSSTNTNNTPNIGTQMEPTAGVWGMGVGYPMMSMGPMGPMAPMMGEMTLGPHMSHTHGYSPMGMSMMSHDGSMIGAQILGAEQIMSDAAQIMTASLPPPSTTPQGTKEIIHCKSCVLFPPNPNAPPPTTRERPPGCRTIFVGGKHCVKSNAANFITRCNPMFVSQDCQKILLKL